MTKQELLKRYVMKLRNDFGKPLLHKEAINDALKAFKLYTYTHKV